MHPDRPRRHRHRAARRSRVLARLGAVIASFALVLAVGAHDPAYAAYGQIEGSGSTWSQVIVDQWIADVNANGMQVTYNGGGSSQGRKNFASYVTDFGISEIPYQGQDELGNVDSAGGREFAYLPIVAGGTAFTYHLEQGGEMIRDIRLSGETIAKIFTLQITSWADPAIKADNNGRIFPDKPIYPVVRSDGSGTSAQFTTWLDKEYPEVWRAFRPGGGLTSYYPIKERTNMIGASGSDQVMNAIAGSSGDGTIGYVEYSYPVNKGFPVVKVLNNAGYYVEPTQYNVAVALTRAQIEQDKSSPLYLTQILDDVYNHDDPRAYPLSSYSYMLIPTGSDDQRMSTNKRQTLVDFMFYSLCEGQSKAGPYGYSPLPLNLVQAGFEQLSKLGAADPGVELQDRDATRCNNPTFVAGDLSRNRLAEIAPQPAECDKAGAGPCLGSGQSLGGGGGTGGGGASGGAGGATGGATGGASGGAGAVGGVTPGGDTTVGVDPETGLPLVDPETGLPVSGGGSNLAVGGSVSSDIAVRPLGGTVGYAALAAAELLAIILTPGLLALRAKKKGVAR